VVALMSGDAAFVDDNNSKIAGFWRRGEGD
jgi:hypothetical protein